MRTLFGPSSPPKSFMHGKLQVSGPVMGKSQLSWPSCRGMWAAIAEHCLPFSQGKAVADLGAGDGTLGKLLQAMV